MGPTDFSPEGNHGPSSWECLPFPGFPFRGLGLLSAAEDGFCSLVRAPNSLVGGDRPHSDCCGRHVRFLLMVF